MQTIIRFFKTIFLVDLLKGMWLTLKYTLDTHCHADHVTGAWLMKQAVGSQIGLAAVYRAENVDRPLAHQDVVRFAKGAADTLAKLPVTGEVRS